MTSIRKKIAYVIDALPLGGAERLLLSLVAALPTDQFEVRVYTIIEQGELAPEFEAIGVKVQTVGKQGKWSWGTVGRLRRLWQEWKPDLVHTHLFAGDTYGRLAAWRSGIPVVTTEHNMNLDERGVKAWVRTILSHLNVKIVAVSRAVKDYSVSREHISAKKIIVIHNGVDGKVFSPQPAEVHAVPVIGMTSRLHPNKGHHFLLQALGLLKNQTFEVLIAGEGSELLRLEKQAEMLDIHQKITFLGLVKDIPSVLKKMDIVALPTVQEGFSLSVVEAMLMEKPVVAFNTGPMNEVIDDGQTGLLVTLGDIPQLAESLECLLKDPELRQRLGQAARRQALQKFSLDYMVKAYVKLYQEVIH